MKKNHNCKICGSKRLWAVKKYNVTNRLNAQWQDAYKVISGLPDHFSIRLGLCRNCGFLFYLDTFSFSQIRQLYQKEARYARPQRHKLKPGRLWEIKQMVKFFEPFLLVAQIQTALDLGSGDFVALERLKNFKKSLIFEALDPSYPAKSRRGIKVYQSMIEDFTPFKEYDLVTAIHILEHIDDLNFFLDRVANLLKDNGYFYVEVPFQVGPGLLLNRSASVQHINYFTPETLTYLLTKNDFQVEKMEFDKNSYYHNGMPGMIRILAKMSQTRFINPPLCFTTLGFILNPFPFLKRLLNHKNESQQFESEVKN